MQGALGDTWHGDKAECRRDWTNKALLLRLPGGKTDLIKFDERGTGRQEGEDGDWVDPDALDEINLNLQRI